MKTVRLLYSIPHKTASKTYPSQWHIAILSGLDGLGTIIIIFSVKNGEQSFEGLDLKMEPPDELGFLEPILKQMNVFLF